MSQKGVHHWLNCPVDSHEVSIFSSVVCLIGCILVLVKRIEMYYDFSFGAAYVVDCAVYTGMHRSDSQQLLCVGFTVKQMAQSALY